MDISNFAFYFCYMCRWQMDDPEIVNNNQTYTLQLKYWLYKFCPFQAMQMETSSNPKVPTKKNNEADMQT